MAHPADLPAGAPVRLRHGARGLSIAGLAACRATLVPPGALVVSTRAPVGRVGMTEVAVSVSQGCKALVPRGGCGTGLCGLPSARPCPRVAPACGGSVFAEVDTATLASLELPLPPARPARGGSDGMGDHGATGGAGCGARGHGGRTARVPPGPAPCPGGRSGRGLNACQGHRRRQASRRAVVMHLMARCAGRLSGPAARRALHYHP
ncbi:hypothetical protein RAA17_16825 [Komagataeibacter rhaeticus]|nr:hypothetical protein [Komagataeibacter rhaeticus]